MAWRPALALGAALGQAQLRQAATDVGGNAMLFRAPDADKTGAAARLHPLTPVLARIHQRLKAEFDPAGIFNLAGCTPRMQTQLAPEYQATADGLAAEAILRKCVHCGFCTATCPTYQLLGDELDGPRGRIYLMKQVLEGATPTRKTQMHLDRCLTCRNCESTCPSGVEYGHLLDIGRKLVDAKVPRPAGERALRWALKEGLPSPLFAPAMALGQLVRPLLPAACKTRCRPNRSAGAWPTREPRAPGAAAGGLRATGHGAQHQPRHRARAGRGRYPDRDRAESRLLRRGQVSPERPGGRHGARCAPTSTPGGPICRPNGHAGVEAILMNASGCGVTVKEYGHILRDDPAYAEKAARISALTQDVSEWLPELSEKLRGKSQQVPTGRRHGRFHPPCSLQHGQQLRGGVEQLPGRAGFQHQGDRLRGAPVLRLGRHLFACCNPDLSHQLRDRKLGHLNTTFGGRRPSHRRRPTSAASRTCKAAPPRRCATGSKCWTRPC